MHMFAANIMTSTTLYSTAQTQFWFKNG